jgi:hypothetical protein
MEELFGILFGLARLILSATLEVAIDPWCWNIPDTKPVRVILGFIIAGFAAFICWELLR